jgi:hypothetical protein
MNAPTFRHPVNRDQAWARYYARSGLRPATRGCRSLTNAERLSRWASKFYALPADIRHGSKAATRGRTAGDSPRSQLVARGASPRLGDEALFPAIDPADLPDWHPDSLHYAGI